MGPILFSFLEGTGGQGGRSTCPHQVILPPLSPAGLSSLLSLWAPAARAISALLACARDARPWEGAAPITAPGTAVPVPDSALAACLTGTGAGLLTRRPPWDPMVPGTWHPCWCRRWCLALWAVLMLRQSRLSPTYRPPSRWADGPG